MDPKRIESSSSISSGVEMEETKTSPPVQEYGPFPGEVAYPPASYYGNPFPSGHQPFLEIPSYPHVFDVPWGMVHQDVPYFNNEYTKVNVDVDSDDGVTREKSDKQIEFGPDYRQFYYGGYPRPFYGGYGYPYPYYGYGAPYLYPRPYVYPFFII